MVMEPVSKVVRWYSCIAPAMVSAAMSLVRHSAYVMMDLAATIVLNALPAITLMLLVVASWIQLAKPIHAAIMEPVMIPAAR